MVNDRDPLCKILPSVKEKLKKGKNHSCVWDCESRQRYQNKVFVGK